jgi:DNA-binding Lrp family transcriptional regulator
MSENMIHAFTLARVQPEKNSEVFERVKQLPMVKDARLVYGEYDIILKTTTKSMKELNQFTYNLVRKVPFVTKTTTMIVARIPGAGQTTEAR